MEDEKPIRRRKSLAVDEETYDKIQALIKSGHGSSMASIVREAIQHHTTVTSLLNYYKNNCDPLLATHGCFGFPNQGKLTKEDVELWKKLTAGI